jgi:glutamate synthase domain-containing protein 2/glutamate synthase domain-containing protein 1/glutamate synthase domain-containing protein 3
MKRTIRPGAAANATGPTPVGLYDGRHEHDACGIGFVVNVRGKRSHSIVQDGLQVLGNLEHRGARGAEPDTGDGAGILIQVPHQAYATLAASEALELPVAGGYGVGMLFLPTDAADRRQIEAICAAVIAERGHSLLGWRTIATDAKSLGATARLTQPVIRQFYVAQPEASDDGVAFERALYLLRKIIDHRVAKDVPRAAGSFYVVSLSHRTVVYKGMLTADQLGAFYPELQHPELQSALALVHARFSTNTFPSWPRAHPYRYLLHNGEINTVQGNVNWMRAREARMASELFGPELADAMPIIDETGSDSAHLDDAVALLTLGGRSLAHAFMMLVPEPWSRDTHMEPARRAFYEYHSCIMEPWDGPAAVAFTDGIQVGAILDRNGLRPARYWVTKDDRVILASEAGVLAIDPQNILHKDRLRPGRMLLIDTERGRIVDDDELKREVVAGADYAGWVRENLTKLDDIPAGPAPVESEPSTLNRLQRAFGYTYEELRLIIEPMTRIGIEPLGSMGNDAPLAVLADGPKLLYSYFKQLFAQVTNPPIDAIREEIVTDTSVTLGAEGNLLAPTAASCRLIELSSPILSRRQLEKLRRLDGVEPAGHRAVGLSTLFPADGDGEALDTALEQLCSDAAAAIEGGATALVLSDRGVDEKHAPIPALLATAAVHHHLIRVGTRTRAGLIVESGEPREVHHLATLIGYGATAVCPYLAYESIDRAIDDGLFSALGSAEAEAGANGGTTVRVPLDKEAARSNYRKASLKGVLKVISKMGISTIQAYHGAQIFESIGIAANVVDRYFVGTAARIQGIGMQEIAAETLLRHHQAFATRSSQSQPLAVGGEYQWRDGGERHLNNPVTIHKLQQACRTGDYAMFRSYTHEVNEQSQARSTLRGMLELRPAGPAVPLDEVESVEAIVRRFKTGAMSYGSISKETHEALAIAMNRIGGKSNTGEGGEDPARYQLDANGDSRNSAIKQVASGRFGVTSLYLVHARELQIKMAQGAKPGEGGQLPGHKVYPWIADVRHSTPGVGLISPPPHHDIYSIEDLAELIHDLKNANTEARISVKLVSEVGVGTVAAGVAKAHADVVLISGSEGGTGASPISSIKHAGLPWELGLAETHQTLLLNNLRDRIAVEVDGQLKTGRDVVVAALLGGEEFGFATAPIIVLGCIMMRVCHLNTCPVGIATQDPELRKKFAGDPEHVINFVRYVAMEVRELMAELGFRRLEDMIGRTDCLVTAPAVNHWKARGLDLEPLLVRPEVPAHYGRHKTVEQDHRLEYAMDNTTLYALALPALEHGTDVRAELAITNADRVTGTIIGSEITRRYGAAGLPEDTIKFSFVGAAGQSFGAFIPQGLSLFLTGEANDYIGKGLSGGKIVVRVAPNSSFVAEENVIVGNVALYGATGGAAYFNGIAGERFCVRNSGAEAVAEGCGDHGCEYMTGGRAVVLGRTGRNFAAGMSGGIAYVHDSDGRFSSRCNGEMVDLLPLESADEIMALRQILERHLVFTGSASAQRILDDWDAAVGRFVKVLPRDYRRMTESIDDFTSRGMGIDEATRAAFEANAAAPGRQTGN